jgi:hypothetical protein
MEKFHRIGLRYKINQFFSKNLKNGDIPAVSFLVILKIFNINTGKEIVFRTKDKEKPTITVLRYLETIDNFENINYEVEKAFFITDYVKAEYKNKQIKINIKNEELKRFGYRFEFEVTEYMKTFIVGEKEIMNTKAKITEDEQITKEEFYSLLKSNDFMEDDNLTLMRTEKCGLFC